MKARGFKKPGHPSIHTIRLLMLSSVCFWFLLMRLYTEATGQATAAAETVGSVARVDGMRSILGEVTPPRGGCADVTDQDRRRQAIDNRSKNEAEAGVPAFIEQLCTRLSCPATPVMPATAASCSHSPSSRGGAIDAQTQLASSTQLSTSCKAYGCNPAPEQKDARESDASSSLLLHVRWLYISVGYTLRLYPAVIRYSPSGKVPRPAHAAPATARGTAAATDTSVVRAPLQRCCLPMKKTRERMVMGVGEQMLDGGNPAHNPRRSVGKLWRVDSWLLPRWRCSGKEANSNRGGRRWRRRRRRVVREKDGRGSTRSNWS